MTPATFFSGGDETALPSSNREMGVYFPRRRGCPCPEALVGQSLAFGSRHSFPDYETYACTVYLLRVYDRLELWFKNDSDPLSFG